MNLLQDRYTENNEICYLVKYGVGIEAKGEKKPLWMKLYLSENVYHGSCSQNSMQILVSWKDSFFLSLSFQTTEFNKEKQGSTFHASTNVFHIRGAKGLLRVFNEVNCLECILPLPSQQLFYNHTIWIQILPPVFIFEKNTFHMCVECNKNYIHLHFLIKLRIHICVSFNFSYLMEIMLCVCDQILLRFQQVYSILL